MNVRHGKIQAGLILCSFLYLAALPSPAHATEDAGKTPGEKIRQEKPLQANTKKADSDKVPADDAASGKLQDRTKRGTGWFPGSRLYPDSIADPRRVAFSGGLRYHDDAFNRFRTRFGTDSHVLGSDKMFGAVSLGSRLPLYRWDVVKGYLQADIEGCVWALFSFKKPGGWLGEASTLLNADYFMSFNTSYSYNNWAVQLRFWHMSSHLGDEFIELYPEIFRRNVSIEGIDIFASYAIIRQVRLFAGIGCIYHSFKDSKFDPFYVEYGAEFRPFDVIRAAKTLNFQPFIAAHLKNWQNNHFAINGNIS
jgi:hypothetical protein